MKRICLIFILLNAAMMLFSQSVWTGNAAVSGEKEFESYYSEDSTTGRYLGASNSFPGSTEVTITNPRNGKTVSVSIVKRLSQPGLFLVLSPEAGDAIELPDDDILNVEVVVRRKNEEVFNTYSDDKPYSEDPDLNPSAELAVESTETVAPEETLNADASDILIDSEVVSTPAASGAEPEIEPPVETGVNEFIPPVVMNNEGTAYEEGYDPLVILEDEVKSSEPVEIVEIIDDPLVLMESITGSVSEPIIPLPETYDSTDLPGSYVIEDTYMDSAPEVIGVTPEERDSQLRTEPEITEVVIVEPEFPESELVETGILEPEEFNIEFMDADISDLLISEAEERDSQLRTEPEPEIAEPEIEETIIPEPEEEIIVIKPETETPENVIYFLTPGDFRPPPRSDDKKDKEKEKTKEKVIVALPVDRSELEEMIVTELRNGGSYLQLGLYGSIDVLYSQIESINDSYPSIVLTIGDEENQLYKLLIGPISRDEKGIIMTRFRSMGYNDAFLYSPK